MQMLAEGPRGLDDLVRQRLLYPPDANNLWVDSAERRTMTQHLDELMADGWVVRVGEASFALGP